MHNFVSFKVLCGLTQSFKMQGESHAPGTPPELCACRKQLMEYPTSSDDHRNSLDITAFVEGLTINIVESQPAAATKHQLGFHSSPYTDCKW